MSDIPAAKSICGCGHTGDGPDGAHAGAIGHGRCTFPGCTCQKFSWRAWTPEFETIMAARQQRMARRAQ